MFPKKHSVLNEKETRGKQAECNRELTALQIAKKIRTTEELGKKGKKRFQIVLFGQNRHSAPTGVSAAGNRALRESDGTTRARTESALQPQTGRRAHAEKRAWGLARAGWGG